MLQKLKRIFVYALTPVMLVLAVNFMTPVIASADVTCPDGTTATTATDCKCNLGTELSCAQNSTTCTVNGKPTGASCTDPAAAGDSQCSANSCDLITKYINPLITLLSAAVGLAVTISIIVGGIQYGSSAGDPQKVTAAKNRIRNSIIALISFLFLYAFLQFLVPGGIFRS